MKWTRDLLRRLENHLVVAMARYEVVGDVAKRDDVAELIEMIRRIDSDGLE